MIGTVWRDAIFLMLLGFMVMVVWMLPLINPPAQDDDTEPPGNVVINITWPATSTADVDLWVIGPGEPRAVGYSNSSGLLFNLLRDDLGTYADATRLNYENAYSRGIIAGEYIVNLHLYRAAVVPIHVNVEVSVKRTGATRGGAKRIAETAVDLFAKGDEVTAVRFTLDKDGGLVPGSMNHVFVPLRAARGEAGWPE